MNVIIIMQFCYGIANIRGGSRISEGGRGVLTGQIL